FNLQHSCLRHGHFPRSAVDAAALRTGIGRGGPSRKPALREHAERAFRRLNRAQGSLLMSSSPSLGWSILPNQMRQVAFMKSMPSTVALPPPSTFTVVAFVSASYSIVTCDF